jgi:hypothetical protein
MVVHEAVRTAIDHITAIADNIEKNARIQTLETALGVAPADPLAIIDRTTMGPMQRRIAVALARRFERWTSTEQLVAAVYSGRPDGGPADADGAVAVMTSHLRRRLTPVGLAIEGVPYTGRRMVWA